MPTFQRLNSSNDIAWPSMVSHHGAPGAATDSVGEPVSRRPRQLPHWLHFANMITVANPVLAVIARA
jgi:hypothetical protein